jgi:hypothetical protein
MAIIYSYQENEELRNSDMLVGTATTLHNGKVRKITKNFTLGQLKTFISTVDLTLSNGGTSGPATLINNILNIPVYQGALTLTTTGSSGAATLIGNTLNIPQYGGVNYTFNAPLTETSGSVSITQATTTTNGYLSSTDWNAFSNKQNAITLTTTGTGAATLVGSTLNIPTPPTATFTSLTTTGSSGSSTLISGVLNVPTYTLAGLGGITLASLSSTATGLTYTNTTGVFSLTAGYSIPTTSSQANWDTAYTNRITSLTTIGTGAATLISNVLNIPTPPTATFTSLTTTGSSGSSTLTAGVLNVPTYTLAGLGGVPTSRTLTINGTAYDLSADRSWSVGTVTSVTATSPITSTGGATPVISTSMATNKLIGRSAAGTGVMEEITIGSGLTLSAGTLAATASGVYVPYTGATSNVDLGTHTLLARDLVINHPSGSGVAASITKGGSGEALTVLKTSGSGNAASILGGVTLIDELHLNTDLSDAYIASAATWNAKQNAITLTTTGSSGASTFVSNTLNIPTYTLSGLGGQPQLNGTGFVKASGTTISYDNTTYYPNPTGTTSQYVRGDGSLATFPTIPGGTVTAVSALTLGTTGTDLNSSVANETTTPVITLNVPTASATNRGALSSADWTTFNGKFTLPSLTSGSVLFSNGTTIAQNNANFFWDNTNNRLGIGTASPGVQFVNSGATLSSGPTLGSGTVGSQALLSNNGLYGMYSGVSSNGDVWHQVQRNDGNTAFYNLALQPSGGNLYLGTNAPIYATPSKVQIFFNGAIEYGINFKTDAAAAIPLSFIANTGTQVGYIIYDTTGTAYTTISDYRLKEDLNPINGLDLISKINVYDYKWKEQDKRSYGVLAHELQEIIPQAVFGEKDGAGMQSVDYSLLVPILIQAIKELEAKITTNK